MRKLKDVLRLSLTPGLSNRKIALITGIGKTAVSRSHHPEMVGASIPGPGRIRGHRVLDARGMACRAPRPPGPPPKRPPGHPPMALGRTRVRAMSARGRSGLCPKNSASGDRCQKVPAGPRSSGQVLDALRLISDGNSIQKSFQVVSRENTAATRFSAPTIGYSLGRGAVPQSARRLPPAIPMHRPEVWSILSTGRAGTGDLR